MAAAFNLHSLSILKSPSRISSIDFFRALAILAVIFCHFGHKVNFGYLGVDLFFVISGFLVGGIVVRTTTEGKHTSFLKFILQRGFKIWPSYYFFILILFWYERGFSWNAMAKYLFFYQNYTGEPSHIWSLCVEEHFYILLPLLFIVIQKFEGNMKITMMKATVWSLIIAGILFKFVSYYYTKSHATFAATHNRLDGLAWGVLLAIRLSENPYVKRTWLYVVAGIIILSASIAASVYSLYFENLFLNSLAPIAFYLIMRGLYYVDFSRLRILRFISYYSYNIFLWHALVGGLIIDKLGFSILTLIVYLISAVLVGAAATILIEEPFLRLRGSLRFLKT